MGEPFVEPGGFERRVCRAHISIAGIDHVLKFMRHGTSRDLAHECGSECVAVLAASIRRQQVEYFSVIARETPGRCWWIQIAGEEEPADVASNSRLARGRELVDRRRIVDVDVAVVVEIGRSAEIPDIGWINELVELITNRLEIPVGKTTGRRRDIADDDRILRYVFNRSRCGRETARGARGLSAIESRWSQDFEGDGRPDGGRIDQSRSQRRIHTRVGANRRRASVTTRSWQFRALDLSQAGFGGFAAHIDHRARQGRLCWCKYVRGGRLGGRLHPIPTDLVAPNVAARDLGVTEYDRVLSSSQRRRYGEPAGCRREGHRAYVADIHTAKVRSYGIRVSWVGCHTRIATPGENERDCKQPNSAIMCALQFAQRMRQTSRR